MNSTVEDAKDSRYKNVKVQFSSTNAQHMHTNLSKSPHVKRRSSSQAVFPAAPLNKSRSFPNILGLQ
jgi:hypothetical protein